MGLLRLLLALSVLIFHLGKSTGIRSIDAGMAVYMFFIISGFYMSLVLSSKYADTPLKAFYASRYLRVLPLFIVANLIVVATRLYLGFAVVDGWSGLSGFQRVAVALANLTGFGTDLFTHVSFVNGVTVFSEYGRDPNQNGFGFVLNPVVWSISIELLFYLAVPFVIRSRAVLCVFSAVGLAYYVSLAAFGATFMEHYRYDLYYPYVVPYFALGIFAHKVSVPGVALPRTGKLYFALVVCVIVLLASPMWVNSYAYLLFTFAIAALFPFTKSSTADRWLGDLSYPVYMLQIPVSNALRALNSTLSEPVVITVVLCCCIASLYIVDRPVERLRARLAKRFAVLSIASAAPCRASERNEVY